MNSEQGRSVELRTVSALEFAEHLGVSDEAEVNRLSSVLTLEGIETGPALAIVNEEWFKHYEFPHLRESIKAFRWKWRALRDNEIGSSVVIMKPRQTERQLLEHQWVRNLGQRPQDLVIVHTEGAVGISMGCMLCNQILKSAEDMEAHVRQLEHVENVK